MRVLILSCNTGEGHNSCGRAIQEAFRGQGIDCEMVDALSFISPSVSQLISSSFNRIYRYTPGLFSRGYRYAEAHPGMFRDGTLVDRAITAGVERTYRYIQDGAYDVAVCTHVFTAMIATEVLRRHAPSLQTYFVATDYTCSPSCGESELDAYFIPDECLADEFAGQGIPRRKLVASGIPIRQAFYASVEREAAKASLSLPPDCRHLLIMSGSMGCGPIPTLVRLIAGGMSEECRVSVVCGSNQRLYRAMEQEYAGDPRVQILGYRKDVPLLMDSADLYMTKPGGISTTEAASKRLPMVLVNAVAGCETYNMRYFIHLGAAATADTPEELAGLALALLTDPAELGRMSDAYRSPAPAPAAEVIRDHILARYQALSGRRPAAAAASVAPPGP